MIRFLFLDLDDTILDFHAGERCAVSASLRTFGVEPTPAVLARYHDINRDHWERLERGELSRPEVLVGRFRALLSELGVQADADALALHYERALGQYHDFLPGAREALDKLKGMARLFLASNGTASVQNSRLRGAGLYPYFEDIFISEEIGFDKPSKAYFDACFARIPDFDRREAMIVGDSLTSDMLGGVNAGLATCWIDASGRTPTLPVDLVLPSLAALPAVLPRFQRRS